MSALDQGMVGPSASRRILCGLTLAELGISGDLASPPPGLEACRSRYAPQHAIFSVCSRRLTRYKIDACPGCLIFGAVLITYD